MRPGGKEEATADTDISKVEGIKAASNDSDVRTERKRQGLDIDHEVPVPANELLKEVVPPNRRRNDQALDS